MIPDATPSLMVLALFSHFRFGGCSPSGGQVRSRRLRKGPRDIVLGKIRF
jgi:hypothetical protein